MPTDPRVLQPTPKARLLALDGGGVRGFFALEIAARIEALLREHTGRPDLVLADWFHYIGGTSTGGIIATFLSWGLPVGEVQRLYHENAARMFTKAKILDSLTRHRFVAEGIQKFLSSYFVESDGSPATLGSSRLRTLLLLVTRNASTGSPWPLSNNPHAKYNDPNSPGCNLAIPLWQLVRASTAAPTYFPPEIMHVKGEHGEPLEFAFEDGGVTPFNNPAFLLYLMASDPVYRLGWQRGPENLHLVSIGTGRARQGRGAELITNLLTQARSLPPALIDSFQQFQDMACRAVGNCVAGPSIDGEVGDMIRLMPDATMAYARYDKTFTSDELQELAAHTKSGFTIDNLELVENLCAAGRKYSSEAVQIEHLT